MIETLTKEIKKPEHGLWGSEKFIEIFTNYLDSEETVFGLETSQSSKSTIKIAGDRQRDSDIPEMNAESIAVGAFETPQNTVREYLSWLPVLGFIFTL